MAKIQSAMLIGESPVFFPVIPGRRYILSIALGADFDGGYLLATCRLDPTNGDVPVAETGQASSTEFIAPGNNLAVHFYGTANGGPVGDVVLVLCPLGV